VSTLTLAALFIQLLDAGQTCAALKRGGIEANPLFGGRMSCSAAIGIKAASLVPLAFPLSPSLRLGVQAGNIGAGSIGVGVSVALFWGPR
jgi:hypothetical protein